MKKLFVPMVCALLLCACGENGSKVGSTDTVLDEEPIVENPHMPSAEARKFCKAENRLADIDVLLRSYQANQSEERFRSLVQMCADLHYDYDPSGMDAEGRRESMLLQARTDSTRIALEELLKDEFATMRFPCISESDHLIEGPQTWPIYLQKGMKLYYAMSTSGVVTMKVHNADSRNTMKTYVGKKQVRDSMVVQNSAIYLFEITPKGSTYIDLKVERQLSDFSQMGEGGDIHIDTMECGATDFMAVKVPGISMKSLFEEPRKFTLRSIGKSFFGGSSRAVITLTVPSGCTDILYSLRVSTNEGDRSDDGQFSQKMSESYEKIKFFGIPVYESNKGHTNLLRELLYKNTPVREEEAYCNVYVFTNQAEAKKFQDGQPTENLKYNIDLSLMGTQSCNGRIPTKGLSKIYLGFANERFRYSNYLWLEAITVSPKNEYYRLRYSLQ
jgi:hypothetical protein